MSAITTYPMLTREQTKEAIKAVGTNVTVMILSEPGCGKTAILHDLEREMGTEEYDFIYIDGPNKEMMDIAASIPNHETKALEYYVASLFKLGNGKKKVIMIDEALKVPKLMQPIYTRMYLERTVGDAPLPDGSIVFATSNNTSDGVGDVLPAHTANRMAIVRMSKPSMKEWLAWAQDSGISSVVRATVAMYPRMLKSYMDAEQADNPYIFQPSKPMMSFVSPRSLHKADYIVKAKLSEDITLGLLAGTLGERGARDMCAFVAMESKVAKIEDVLKNPETVPMPNEDDVAPLLLMIFQALDHIESQDDLNRFQKFVNRIRSQEVQSVWFVVLLRSNKAKLARSNPEVQKWALENHNLI
jgi:hypothetical protein